MSKSTPSNLSPVPPFRVVITGGSGGLGLAIARAFAREGASLWLIARDPKKLKATRKRLTACYGGSVRISSANLVSPAEIQGVTAQIAATWDSVTALINNAGLARFVPLDKVRPDDLRAQIQINLLTPYLLIQALLAPLTAARGCVINISSSSAQRHLIERPASVYSMSKGGLNALTQSLACELGVRGVRINAIAPGTLDTGQHQRTLSRLSPSERAAFSKRLARSFPLGRIGRPEDVAELAVFLASPEAAWLTGAVIPVDGGLTTT